MRKSISAVMNSICFCKCDVVKSLGTCYVWAIKDNINPLPGFERLFTVVSYTFTFFASTGIRAHRHLMQQYLSNTGRRLSRLAGLVLGKSVSTSPFFFFFFTNRSKDGVWAGNEQVIYKAWASRPGGSRGLVWAAGATTSCFSNLPSACSHF